MNNSRSNIRLIIEGCLKSNAPSQDKLFELYYGFVMSTCSRYASSSESAKEMLNDTFYTVFKNIHKYDSQFPFEPWLRRVCINCCLKYKKKYFSNWSFKDLATLEDNSSLSLQENLPDIDELNYLNLLKHLPEACKTIINLYVIEEYKHHEIAELLNISVGTSKSNLHRAKQLLYKMLEKDSKGRLKLKSNYGG